MVFGFLMGVALFETVDPPTRGNKYAKIGAWVMVAGLAVGGLVLFYTAVDSDSDD
jgi:uncharacterized membrane protein